MSSHEAIRIFPAAGCTVSAFSGGPGANSPGQLRITNYSLAGIIQIAFEKKRSWENAFPASPPIKWYDITANAPDAVTRGEFVPHLR